ncbi:hypothetical protein FLAG1_07298 [Fusarium langsethiae]|uniref:Uncharacterized protein n=1 Tax=Fusarium langsethiae TaxID=179993 RepID=A0A0M9ETY2_FUSLA|nr:hypothetical protein FLAG1_07298 [Fusarium langsethiae]
MEHQWVHQRPAEARQFGSWTRAYLVAEVAEWGGKQSIYLPGRAEVLRTSAAMYRMSTPTAIRETKNTSYLHLPATCLWRRPCRVAALSLERAELGHLTSSLSSISSPSPASLPASPGQVRSPPPDHLSVRQTNQYQQPSFAPLPVHVSSISPTSSHHHHQSTTAPALSLSRV